MLQRNSLRLERLQYSNLVFSKHYQTFLGLHTTFFASILMIVPTEQTMIATSTVQQFSGFSTVLPSTCDNDSMYVDIVYKTAILCFFRYSFVNICGLSQVFLSFFVHIRSFLWTMSGYHLPTPVH
jgi:hypothetical protein